MIDLTKISCIEILDQKRHIYINHDINDSNFEIQSDGENLKIFIKYKDEENNSD